MSTVGVVFLATPFFGSSVARVFKWQVSANNIRGEQTSTQLIEDLNQDADFVHQRAQKFAELANKASIRLPVSCFFETKKTEVLKHFLPLRLVKFLTSEHTQEMVRTFLAQPRCV